ncbi:hypothetical protein [Streptomyces zaomyceticus]|uniref:hypothetical protein n=1 Tax=Streptomyces zaomyceticus TaxID=68286 RepID=UPI00378908A4
MATAPAWTEGTEYNGQAEHDDFDFCTVGEVTYMCRVSHVACPDTHPTHGPDGRKTWARAAREGLDSLNRTSSYLKSVLGAVQFSRMRLAPAALNAEERQRFDLLTELLHSTARELLEEIEQTIAEHPRTARHSRPGGDQGDPPVTHAGDHATGH